MEFDPSVVSALISGVLASPVGRELSFSLEQALEVTDALWDLVPVVEAAGQQYDQKPPAQVADSSPAGPRLAEDRRVQVRAIADAMMGIHEAALAGREFDEEALSGLSERDAMADPFGIVARLIDVPQQAALAVSAMEQASGLSGDEMFYLRAYMRACSKSARTPMLLRAVFVASIGTVEPLVTRLVLLLLYHGSPGAYGSLADSRLEERARELCFGAPGRWRRTLVDTLGVTALAEAVDWARLTVLWEDRNVIAHRGGVSDSRHSDRTGSPVGRILSPDADAVRSAIDVIGAASFALVACTWEHLDPRIGDVIAEIAGPAIWESLRAGRWEQAELLGKTQEVLATEPEYKAIAKVHRWLAADLGRGPGAIHAEVEAWDVTGLPQVFKAARHVLLREDDRALALLRKMLDEGALTRADIDTWPLFDRLRAHGQLQARSDNPIH
jgi:hypothetical protein